METTLTKVVRKAYKDKKFLNALTKDVAQALKEYELTLSPDDRRILRTLFGEIGTAGERKLLRYIGLGAGGNVPWPPPWTSLGKPRTRGGR
jgi:hypothetical protein